MKIPTNKWTIAAIALSAGASVAPGATINISNITTNASTVLLWNLDEGSGTTAASSATALGTYDGTITPNTTWTTGKFGSGLNGVAGDSGTVASGAIGVEGWGTGIFVDQFSMDAWIRPTAIAPGGSFVMGFGGGHPYYAYLRLFSGTVYGFGLYTKADSGDQWAESGAQNLSGVDLLDGNWHHIAATYNQGTLSLIVNAVSQYSASKVPTSNVLYLNGGRFNAAGGNPYSNVGTDSGNNFVGDIDQIRVSNTADTYVIPEPGTYALLTLAAAGLGAHVVRRRRRD